MTERDFKKLLKAQWAHNKFLCVGLDPDLEKIPSSSAKGSNISETIASFNRAIIDATKDIVCAYKPNPAFYEAHGLEGWKALEETITYIRAVAPDVPVILDAKRGDVSHTNKSYAVMAFDSLKADALTVQPYAGGEALTPFFERKDKGIFWLVRTSNPGAGEFQDLRIDGEELYKITSRAATRWNTNGNCGVVVGTTYPEELAAVRAIVGDMPILMPGTGAQGGDLTASVKAGGKRIIMVAGRAILYASHGTDFAEAARAKAEEFHSGIQKALVE